MERFGLPAEVVEQIKHVMAGYPLISTALQPCKTRS